VATEGQVGGPASRDVFFAGSTWKDLTDNVQTRWRRTDRSGEQHRNEGHRTRFFARGDLSRKSHRRRAGRDPRAEEHDQHDGRSVERLRFGSLAPRAARSARGQAARLRRRLPGVAGYMEGPNGNVKNAMASNLTSVRNIAEVTTARREGRPVAQDTVDSRGESSSSRHINTMVDQLKRLSRRKCRASRARVARGQLGGPSGSGRAVAGYVGRTSPDKRQLDGGQPDQPGARNIAEVTCRRVEAGDCRARSPRRSKARSSS